jgi:hypothetical protein
LLNANELLEKAIQETEELRPDEVFLLKDLFKGYEWRRIPVNERLLLGTLFLNYVNSNDIKVIAIEKTSSNQQRYKKLRHAIPIC